MRTLLIISILLNLGLGFFALTREQPHVKSIEAAAPIQTNETDEPIDLVQELPIAISEPEATSEGLNWTQIESPDYKVYVANLRSIGCPERTIRDILHADLEDWFIQERKKVMDPVSLRFWEVAMNGMDDSVREEKKRVKQLEKDRDELLAEVLGKTPVEKPEDRPQKRTNSDFLSEEKLARVDDIENRYKKLRSEAEKEGKNLPPDELRQKMKDLDGKKQEEITAALSPKELEEYRLRTSRSANMGRNLVGFDATEDELKVLAKINLKYDETGSKDAKNQLTEESRKQRDEEIKQMWGNRYAEFKRSLDGDFIQIYRVAQRYELSKELAVEVDEIRKAAMSQADQIRKNIKFSPEEQEQLLRTIQSETQKTLEQTFGAAPAATYGKYGGQWIQTLGQTNQNKPKP